MSLNRVSIGFDLRMNPDSQPDGIRRDRRLVPELGSPVSADPNVWLRDDEMESFINKVL